jgi:hypothetical protein
MYNIETTSIHHREFFVILTAGKNLNVKRSEEFSVTMTYGDRR